MVGLTVGVSVDALPQWPVSTASSPGVLIVAQDPHVRRVHASLLLAQMVEGVPQRNGPLGKFPRGPMCEDYEAFTATLPSDLRVSVAGG